MRGIFFLTVVGLAATAAQASIGYDFSDGADTSVLIVNTGYGNALVLEAPGNALEVKSTGMASGIRAEGLYYGIEAYATNGGGVHGEGNTGVSGVGTNAYGVIGVSLSANGFGVSGQNSEPGGIGVRGQGYANGVFGEVWEDNANGVYGLNIHNGGTGVKGVADEYDAIGVLGESVNGTAVKGVSVNGTGVRGEGNYNGVIGTTSGYWYDYGVSGTGTMVGVSGNAAYYGVTGYSSENYSIGVSGESSGEYGVGVQGAAWNTGAYAGVFNGNVAVYGDCDPCSPSDGRFKKNVKDMTGGLSKVMALKPKTYEMKTDEFKGVMNFSKGTKYGLMAEDLAAVMPELVHSIRTPAKKDAKGVPVKGAVGEEYKAIAYSRLIPVLISAIQELEAKVEALEKGR